MYTSCVHRRYPAKKWIIAQWGLAFKIKHDLAMGREGSIGLLCCCYLLSHIWLSVIPWTVAHQARYLCMGFPRQEYWSGLPFPFPGDLPDPGIELRSPTLQADALPSEPPVIIRRKVWYFFKNLLELQRACFSVIGIKFTDRNAQ